MWSAYRDIDPLVPRMLLVKPHLQVVVRSPRTTRRQPSAREGCCPPGTAWNSCDMRSPIARTSRPRSRIAVPSTFGCIPPRPCPADRNTERRGGGSMEAARAASHDSRELCRSFTREADDDVGPDGGVRDRRPDALDELAVIGGRIRTPHRAQHLHRSRAAAAGGSAARGAATPLPARQSPAVQSIGSSELIRNSTSSSQSRERANERRQRRAVSRSRPYGPEVHARDRDLLVAGRPPRDRRRASRRQRP